MFEYLHELYGSETIRAAVGMQTVVFRAFQVID